MRQQLLDLYEIQKIDLTIREQEQRQLQLPSALNRLDASVHDLERKLNTHTEQGEAAAREARALQATVETEKDKIRKWEARLSEIRNQREYQALQRETEGSKRANRDAEEKIKELLARKETSEQQLVTVREALAQAKVAQAEEQAKVKAGLAALQTEIEAEQARRNVLLPRVPKALFQTYDSVRSRRMGQGLALVSQGCCTGCHIRLPPQLYNILQRGNSIEQCPSCRRLMFWDHFLPTDDAQADVPQDKSQDTQNLTA